MVVNFNMPTTKKLKIHWNIPKIVAIANKNKEMRVQQRFINIKTKKKTFQIVM
jgi:hypothetical protein